MDSTLFQRTVRMLPDPIEAKNETLTLMLGGSSSKITPWGKNWVRRDKQLAEFVETEPFLKSTIYSIATTRAALSWELDGPPRTVKKVKDMLEHSDLSQGWVSLMMKVGIDLLHFDNGAFIEIVRDKPPRGSGRKPESMPVLGLVHLSSNRCYRTGNPLAPVYYMDDDGKMHLLKWYQVMTLEEMPMPFEEQKNRQLSFVSRVLQGAQVIAEIARYKDEKVSGRFSRALHLVGGVAKHEIENAKNVAQMEANNMGLMRYMEPIIMASLDPNAKVSHVQIDLATLPDSFDEDIVMKWYITLLALAAGGDFQDLAPLPGGNLGTASQSEILHRKSRAKGTQLWMKLIEHKMKVHKVMPRNVSFKYSVADASAEMEKAKIQQVRATTRQTQIASGEIIPEVARQIAVDDGDIKQEHLIMMQQPDQIGGVTIQDDEEVSDFLINPPDVQPIETEPEPADNLTESDDKALSPIMAAKAAKWWTQTIRQSPMQTVAPIDDYKLRVFEQSLRNQLKTRTKFGTSLGWMSGLLINAATDAGIHALALRHRLPDNYFVLVGNKAIVDSRGNTIYKVKEKVQPVETHFCEADCDAENPRLNYVPFQGFKWLCQAHTQGLVLTEKSLAAVNKALADMSGKYYGDKIVAGIQAAYEIGLGRPANFNRVKAAMETEMESLAVLKSQPELLTLAIYKWYLRGVKNSL